MHHSDFFVHGPVWLRSDPPPPSHTNLQNLHFFDTNSFVVSNGKEMATPNFVAMGRVSAHPVGDICDPARVCVFSVRCVFVRTAQHSEQCSAAVQMLSLPPTSVECGFDTCPPYFGPPRRDSGVIFVRARCVFALRVRERAQEAESWIFSKIF